ncbi:hypothetical protein BLOT_016085 [Blomia tropicalis]|nr:hypothetical protein BLOT_016085 [Blomia tropicalis]
MSASRISLSLLHRVGICPLLQLLAIRRGRDDAVDVDHEALLMELYSSNLQSVSINILHSNRFILSKSVMSKLVSGPA